MDSKMRCHQQLLRKGGWHFSSVLRDADILKKIQTFAHGSNPNFEIKDFTSFKNFSSYRSNNAENPVHLYIIDKESDILPQELKNPLYSEYFAKFSPNQQKISIIQDHRIVHQY
jgi:hypothetical protein